MKYIFILSSFITLLFSASVSTQLPQHYYEDDFEKIIRFDMLHFEKDVLDTQSQKRFDSILQTLQSLKREGKTFQVTIVGHMYNANDYYPPKNRKSLKYITELQETVDDKSSYYANTVANMFIQNGIEKNHFSLSAKSGFYPNATDAEKESALSSNRVMVSLYIMPSVDVDSDNDGVYDRFDRCKQTPINAAVDKNGCPIDSDNDGVFDYQDKCPGKPPIGIMADKDGCPLDSDNDGVDDYKDKCENTPKGISVDISGCPLKETLKVFFQRGSAKIMRNSYPEIQRFANFLKKNTGYKVKIIGHTDSRGKAETNMKLSIRRAEAIKNALILEGINPSRIITVGRGELDPIASNRTKEGRAKNRRIEIELF